MKLFTVGNFGEAALSVSVPAADLLKVSEGRAAVAGITRVLPGATARILAASALSVAVGRGAASATAPTAVTGDPATGAAEASWLVPTAVTAAITRMVLVLKIL